MALIPGNGRLVDDGILASGKKLRFRQLGDRLSALYRGSRYPTMSSPPTLTYGTNVSTVDATKLNGTVTHAANSDRFVHVGSVFLDGTYGGSIPMKVPSGITLSTNAKTGGTGPMRVRFMSDAPAIDFCFSDRAFSQVNVIIDGEVAYRSKQVTFTNTGNTRYIKADFGANTTTYPRAQLGSTGITTGGSGHAVGDVITFDDGTNDAGGTACTMKVISVSSGAVTGLDIVNPGAYTVAPTGTLTQASTTGSGTGLTIPSLFFTPAHTTRKMRSWELIYTTPAEFLGLVTAAGDIVVPWPVNPGVPKLCVIGDSITAGVYLGYGGGHLAYDMAQRMGLADSLIVSAQGGTGYSTTNGTALKWSDSRRIADVVAHQADIYVLIGSQNDPTTTLTADVTTVVDGILSGCPNALVAGVGNVMAGSTAIAAAVAAGFAAARDQSRVRFHNNQSPHQWLTTTYLPLYAVVNDNAHLGQQGQDMFATLATQVVHQMLMDMCS